MTKFAPPQGELPVLQYCTPGQLRIDPLYQRQLDDRSHKLIRQIAGGWDWGLCQPLVVARRDDGRLFVIDGQHRLEAARLRGDLPQLPCVVLTSASAAREADAFVRLNQARRPLTPRALFVAAVASGDECARTLSKMIDEAGLTLAGSADWRAWPPGTISNIAGLRNIHRRLGDRVTDQALHQLARAFAGQVQRYGGTLFYGIAGAIDEIRARGSEADMDLLQLVLEGVDQIGWYGDILAAAAARGMDVRTAAVALIREAYDEAAAELQEEAA